VSDTDTNPEAMTDELSVLKTRARTMGIEFSNNIKLGTLRERVAAKMNEEPAQDEEQDEDEDEIVDAEVSTAPAKKLSPKMTIREELLASQMKLVRLRITNMDPNKKDLPGEVLTVANEYIGTVSKFIPFGEATDEGYHVPFCLYKMMEERRFQLIRTTRDRRTGTPSTTSSWQKEFALEVLPQLTEAELADLARAQIAAGSINSSGDDYMS
jgi:hypothetical protein